jgi:protocatechuate 3,4-dioxygenase, beta subunit
MRWQQIREQILERDFSGYIRPEPGTQPDYLFPDYVSTRKRSPTRPLILLPHTISETTGPIFGHDEIAENDNDLTRQHTAEPLGERIIISGQIKDQNGRPVRDSLLEVWQANAAGRYGHKGDNHAAPLDPNFTGCGRMLTDSQGVYRMVTIKPGAYPWQNHSNAWRPAHIHFSIFGAGLLTRLVTQMYFPGDPLLPHDPIFNSIPDDKARVRLIANFDWATTSPGHALGYRFDIVLRGRESTPMEESR